MCIFISRNHVNIGINARTFIVEEPDGVVQTAINISRELHQSPDCNVELYGHEDAEKWFNSVDVHGPYYYSQSPFFGVIWERTVLPRIAKRQSPDILLCPNGNPPLTSSESYQTVVYIHDVNALKDMSSSIHGAYRRATIPRSASIADSVITVSEFSKQQIASEISITPEKISVIHNGIDDYYRESSPGSPCDLPESYLLYVGAMNPRKNVTGVVESFRQFKDEYDTPHKLVLIGPENRLVYDEFELDGLSDDIVTPGYLPIEELKYAYRNADVFLFLSHYEGFGLPPLEAMACGTPVIASDTSSLPEVLGGAARLVDPNDTGEIADTINDVLSDEEQQETLVKRGRERASRFTWERAGEELRSVCQDVTTSRGRY